LTTAGAFVSRVLSECAAFAQLGTLLAIGVLFASVLMMTVFFACVSRKHQPTGHDFLFESGKRYVHAVFQNPKPILIGTGLFLVAMSVAAVAPIGQLRLEADPKAMEPKCAASDALHKIQEKFPAAHDPMLVLVSAQNAEEFHDSWAKLQARWSPLVESHELKSYLSPAGFALSPERMRQNLVTLAKVNVPAAHEALTKTLATEDFNANDESFQNSFALLDSLQSTVNTGSAPIADWRKLLPHSSSWWFLFDQFFAKNSMLSAAYITPNEKIRSNTAKQELAEKLTVPGVTMHITGWTYVLADLIPWAKHKLALLSVTMIVFNIALLAYLYRRAEPLLILMLSLALSIGALITCLKLFGFALNLFNVLAFPLVLGVGVDYGIYILLALRQPGDKEHAFATIIKPVLLAGLTTIAGFGSLALAHNPALQGLGIVCALGVAWCLFTTFFFILPAYVARADRA
jgi:predicted RND superfamily exporter protein